MNFAEIIQTHQSIRKYTDEPVSDESIKQIFEAAQLSPSGNNAQPWRFKIVKSKENGRGFILVKTKSLEVNIFMLKYTSIDVYINIKNT